LRSSHASITIVFCLRYPHQQTKLYTDTHARRQKETEEDITAAYKRREKKKQEKKTAEQSTQSRERAKSRSPLFSVFYSVVVVFGALYQPQHVTFLKYIRTYVYCTKRYELRKKCQWLINGTIIEAK
jgi:hypothetical protein